MNPDTLRKEAESLRTDPRGLGVYAGRVAAHADAWEARERILAQQIERNGRFVASEKALYDEVVALRQRLEAARLALDALRSIPAVRHVLGTHHTVGCGCGLCLADAALAAGEET